jgi:hypothetical protein
MSGWYEVSKNELGEFRFVLKAANGEIVLRSQQYTSKASALNGVTSVQTNASDDARYELKASNDNRFYFNLLAANGQVVGTSQMYASESSRSEGIASVKANAPKADVREL